MMAGPAKRLQRQTETPLKLDPVPDVVCLIGPSDDLERRVLLVIPDLDPLNGPLREQPNRRNPSGL